MIGPAALLLASLAAPPPAARTADASTAAKPARLVAGSITNDDYPVGAIRAEAQGASQLEVAIAADGRVTGCDVAQSSGSPLLDQTACGIVLERFRYQPARDEFGRRTAIRQPYRVLWRLPSVEESIAGPIIPFVAGEVRIAISFDEGVFRCAFELNGSAFEPLRLTTCPPDALVPMADLVTDRSALMTTTTLVPEGASAPNRIARRGALLQVIVADLEVAPDGRMTGCTRIDSGFPDPPAGAAQPHLCDMPTEVRPRFTPATDMATRRARLRIERSQMGAPEL